jgi:hypothetical protein
MFFGLIIIIVGLVFLLKNLGFIGGDVWPIIWPSLVIVVGLSILCKKKKHEQKWHKFGEGMKRFGEEMHKTFGGEEKEE